MNGLRVSLEPNATQSKETCDMSIDSGFNSQGIKEHAQFVYLVWRLTRLPQLTYLLRSTKGEQRESGRHLRQ